MGKVKKKSRKPPEVFSYEDEILRLLRKFFKGDGNKVSTWLATPNPLLGGVTPQDYALIKSASQLHKFITQQLEENEPPPRTLCQRHRHYYRDIGSTGGHGKKMIVIARCRCGAERQRPATVAERREAAKVWRRSTEIHHTWHSLTDKFFDWKTRKWKLTSYALMTAVEKWAKRHPEVAIAGCDDAVHANSDLVLVPHALADEYMGTSVLYVPQCTGEDPISFFLYPGDHGELEAALKKIRREHGKKKGWRR